MTAYQLTQDAQSDILEIRRYTVEQWGNPLPRLRYPYQPCRKARLTNPT